MRRSRDRHAASREALVAGRTPRLPWLRAALATSTALARGERLAKTALTRPAAPLTHQR